MSKLKSGNSIYFAYLFLLGLYISSFQSCVTKLSAELGGRSWLISLFITLHFIGSMLSPVVAGEISDRVGKKPVLIGASFAMIAGLILLAVHPNVVLAGAAIFIIGACLSALEGQMSAVLSDINPGKSDKVLNDSQVFNCVGAVLGPILLLSLQKAGGIWEFGIWLIVLLFTASTIWLSKTPVAKSEQVPSPKPQKSAYSKILLKDLLFLILLVAIFLYVAIEEGAAFYVNTLFGSNQALLATISLSGFWGGMILLRFLTARFYQHARKIMSISILGAFVTLVLLQAGISPYLDAALFILLGSSLAVIWPLLMSVCNQVFGAYSGTASGLMMMAGGLGGIAGPTGMNVLSPFTGAHHVMLLLAVAAAIMGFLWWRTVVITRNKKSL